MKPLVDSVSRNFPIGSLLVLAESSPAMPTLAARPIAATLEASERNEDPIVPPPDAAEPSRQDSYYVLDGQQRLTSPVRVFLDAGTEKSYYVDLKRLFEQDERLRDAALPGSVRERDFAKRFSLLAFDQFLRGRAAAILGHVRDAIGDSLAAGRRPATVDDPEDLVDEDD